MCVNKPLIRLKWRKIRSLCPLYIIGFVECGFCNDGKCENTWSDKKCKSMKHKCNKSDVMENCKETCGFCDDGMTGSEHLGNRF